MVEEAGWIQDLLDEEEPASPENLEEIERAASQIRTQGDAARKSPTSCSRLPARPTPPQRISTSTP
jgi:hypothetical protein